MFLYTLLSWNNELQCLHCVKRTSNVLPRYNFPITIINERRKWIHTLFQVIPARQYKQIINCLPVPSNS